MKSFAILAILLVTIVAVSCSGYYGGSGYGLGGGFGGHGGNSWVGKTYHTPGYTHVSHSSSGPNGHVLVSHSSSGPSMKGGYGGGSYGGGGFGGGSYGKGGY